MSTLSHKQHAASKVLVKADKWADQREALHRAAPHEKARAAGRYEISGKELAEAVEHYRKAEKAGE